MINGHRLCSDRRATEPNREATMTYSLEGCTEEHRTEAEAELEAELAEFSFDGLVQLREDLARGRVLRGSWTGCVISYKAGAPGSTRRDRHGRARNTFTALWDDGWITDEEVLTAIQRETAARRMPGVDGRAGAPTLRPCRTSTGFPSS